mgnify:CR=1 FL=1
MEQNVHTIEFDEELYNKNISEKTYPEDDGFNGLSEEDKEELKKQGLL